MNYNLQIRSTTKPEKPAKNIQEWANYLLKLGCRLSSSYDYNLKETKPLKLRGN